MTATYRAGAIGRTGQGDYGHALDVAYEGIPNVEFIAVADPDLDGRQVAAGRTGLSNPKLTTGRCWRKQTSI